MERYKVTTSRESRYLSNESNIVEPFYETKEVINNNDELLEKRENRFNIESEIIKEFFNNKDVSITRKVHNDNDYKVDVKYCSRGFINDYSKSSGIESVVYRGLTK